MYQVKDLTALTLKDLWREVKSEEDWWGEINERVLGMVKLILESSLEEELLAELQVRRYQRSRQRTGYRNGYYPRDLYTTFGVIKSLRVPRARERYDCRILPRYQRRQDEINEMVRNMFLAGVSTRRVGEVLAKIGGEKISAQTVSRIAQSLDAEVDRFHRQSLSDSYQYLLLDGICLR
jgi:transposase-like protein